MSMPFEEPEDRTRLRSRIIGLGEHSLHKSYYPELKQQLAQLDQYRTRLEDLVRERTRALEEANSRLASEIIRRQEVEQVLAAEKERLMVTLQSIGDGVLSTNVQGLVTFQNPMAEMITGVGSSHAVGRPVSDIVSMGGEKNRIHVLVSEVIQSGVAAEETNPFEITSQDGKKRRITQSVSPISGPGGSVTGVVIVLRDMTELIRVEEEREKMLRLESIGLLAGGIAHDYNNILTAILGNISGSLLYIEAKGPAYDMLTEAEKAIMRARHLTTQLLTFSKGGAPVKKSSRIQDIIRETSRFALSGSRSRVEFDLPENLPPVLIDEAQISQVIQNIVINADHAMPNGGVVAIRASYDTGSYPGADGEKPGPFMKISIADTGVGIKKEDLAHIFDPYFTTKQKGSGLGLTGALFIVKKHDGSIDVQSEPGVGTTVTMYLPVRKENQKGPDIPSMTHDNQVSGTVLLMDDEEPILDVMEKLLTKKGFIVSTARDGREAVEIYKKSLEKGQRFDVVIMDLTIPGGMGGKETIRELLAIDPHVTAVASSGYSNDPIMSEFSSYGFSAILPKPYNIRDLVELVRSIILQKNPNG